MAYIQNGIHSKWHGIHGIAKQFNTAKIGHESNNKVIQNTGDMFNHTFNGMANWSINKLNNTGFKHLIHESKHAKLHLSKIYTTRRKSRCDAENQKARGQKIHGAFENKLCRPKSPKFTLNCVFYENSACQKTSFGSTEVRTGS